MFRRNIRLLSIGLGLISTGQGLSASGSDWMSRISGSKKISRITLPGTHDSGARVEPFGGTAKTQNASIRQQLDFGIRFLDVRCRHVGNTFQIHHGPIYQNLTFQQVLDQTYSFLSANPTETVVMSIKEEHTPSNNTRSFTQTFDSFVNQNPSRWALGSNVPELNEVRGKIVLLRRFSRSSAQGINASNWPDNTGFDRNNLVVQDYYRVNDNAQKWNRVVSALNAARSETNSNKIHINFASGVRSNFLGIPNIPSVSNYMNPRLQNYFGNASSANYGWVIMDFANDTRTRLIYETNQVAGVNPPFGWTQLQFRHSGKCVDNKGLTNKGAEYHQWSCGVHSNRNFKFESRGGGWWGIRSQTSGLCLDVAYGSTANGGKLNQWSCNSSINQSWKIVDSGGGWFNLKSRRSNKCVHQHGGNQNNGGRITQWNCGSRHNILLRYK